MEPKRHGLFCRLRSRVRRLARREGDRSASHDSASLSSDDTLHEPYLNINIHGSDESNSTAFLSSTSSSTTTRSQAILTPTASEQYSVDPRDPNLRRIRDTLDSIRGAGASQPGSSMPGERDGSPSTHDAGGPSLTPVTEEAATQANPGAQRPLPAIPRVDDAAPPLAAPSDPGPSSAPPLRAQAQPATAANISGEPGSAPRRPPRNPERAQAVAARDAGEPLVAPNTGESSAQANPDPQPPSPAPTHIEYPASPPPAAASPSPAASEPASAVPQPAMPTIPEFLSRITRTLDTISEQLETNNNVIVERINITSGHSYRILGDIVRALTQRRDGRSATLSSSYEAPSGASGALPPEPPEVVSGIPAGRAETPQPELIADSEQSPYVPTELDTPLDSASPSLSVEFFGMDSELMPVGLGRDGAQTTQDATGPTQSLGLVSGPLDENEVGENAAGTREGVVASVDAPGVSSQPDPTSSADVGQADDSQGPGAPFDAPAPASDAASLSETEREDADAQPQAALNEDPFDTLVSCRSTSELFPGTLQLIVDVGTDGTVRAGDKLFFLGDLDEARQRLPGICAKRRTEWSQLYLRIRKPMYKGQDSMMRVMRCLRPYLRYFLAVRLVMDDKPDVENLDERAFTDDFARLLSLSVEGLCSQSRILLFPLNDLRHLIIETHLSDYAMLDIINRAESLQTLQLKITRSQRGQDGQVNEPEAPLQGIRLPSCVFITANDPARALPYLHAAETATADVRLKVNHGLRSSALKEIFERHDSWVISAK